MIEKNIILGDLMIENIGEKKEYLENANRLGIKTINYKFHQSIDDLKNSLKEKEIKLA